MPDKTEAAEFCHQCARLLGEYLAAAREARVSLEAVTSAPEDALLDELGSLVADAQVESALSNLSQAQKAYERHHQERHAPTLRLDFQ
jgi:hypothetical protein